MALQPCLQCNAPNICAQYVHNGIDDSNTCYCGHLLANHASRIHPARGGCATTQCTQYQNPISGGREAWDFRQSCRNCQGIYSQHLPEQVAVATGAQPQPPATQALLGSQQPSATQPQLGGQPLTGQHQVFPPTQSLPNGFGLSQPPAPNVFGLHQPQPSASASNVVAGYQPQGTNIFGGGPQYAGQTVAAHQLQLSNQPGANMFGGAAPLVQLPFPITPYAPGLPVSSGVTTGTTLQTQNHNTSAGNSSGRPMLRRIQKLKWKSTVLHFPRDVSADEATAVDAQGLSGPYSYARGVPLDLIIETMVNAGMATTVEFTSTNAADDCLYDQLFDVWQAHLARTHIKLIEPPPQEHSGLFPGSAANPSTRAELLQRRISLSPFHLIKFGNCSGGTVRLSIDSSANIPSAYTYKAFKVHDTKPHRKYSKDEAKYGTIMAICPKGGAQFLGPPPLNGVPGLHRCFSDRIISLFAKGIIYKRAGFVWGPAQDEEWLNSPECLAGSSCRANCVVPLEHTTSHTLAFPNADAHHIHAHAQVPQLPAPQAAPEDVPQRLLPLPYTPPPRNEDVAESYAYTFSDLRGWYVVEIEARLAGVYPTIHPDTTLTFAGDSVEAIADGIITGLATAAKASGRNLDMAAANVTSMNLINKHPGYPVAINDMLKYHHWEFVITGAEDGIGNGVMRQVLSACIAQLHSSPWGLLEDTINSDDFKTLSVSPAYVNEHRLDMIWVMGVLSTFFMVKTHSVPFPITPALILLCISEKATHLQDLKWIKYVYPYVGEYLERIPDDGEAPIPANDTNLRHFIEMKLLGTTFHTFANSPPDDRAKLKQSLIFNSLLNYADTVLFQSPEFIAFQAGMNVEVNGQSLGQFLKDKSLKPLLANLCTTQIKNSYDVVDRLDFEKRIAGDPLPYRAGVGVAPPLVISDEAFERFKIVVYRYLHGKGHVFKSSRMVPYVTREVRDQEHEDALLRCKRFLKVTTGLATLPPSANDKITIVLTNQIPDLLRGSHDPTQELVPPTSHACLHEIDVYLTPWLLTQLEEQVVELGTDTELDWMMHCAVFKLGIDNEDRFN